MTGMVVGQETVRDTAFIGPLVASAVETAAVSSGTEAQIVERLRAAGALMLSLVAEKSGTIVGQIAVSATTTGSQPDWAHIGPVSVLGSR